MRKNSNIITLSNRVICVSTIPYAHKNILAFLCLVVLVISGCSTYEQDFDCPPGAGMGCVSISEVNSVVDKAQESFQKGQQRVPLKIEEEGALEKECPTCKVKEEESSSTISPLLPTHQNKSNNSANVLGRVHRTQERTARVWIAPYEDEEGNFWEEGYVHVLLKPSHWNSEAVQ